LEAFAGALTGLFRRQARLSEWADEIVRRNCAAPGLPKAESVPIATYLTAVAPLSRKAAFDAMYEWWLA
jgi:NAD(P)-dependent dehydrogenase (short-subunit alcohol dehydrogenase family)